MNADTLATRVILPCSHELCASTNCLWDGESVDAQCEHGATQVRNPFSLSLEPPWFSCGWISNLYSFQLSKLTLLKVCASSMTGVESLCASVIATGPRIIPMYLYIVNLLLLICVLSEPDRGIARRNSAKREREGGCLHKSGSIFRKACILGCHEKCFLLDATGF
jgi:hypothetical protein